MKILLLIFLYVTNLFAQEPTSATFLKLIKANGYQPPISEFHTDLMSFLKVKPIDGQDIVLLNINPNIGDNLINNNPLISYLHQKYPNSKIKYISPTADLLNKSDWLEPVKLDLKNFENSKQTGKTLSDFWSHVHQTVDQQLGKNSFYLSDGVDYAALKDRYFSGEAGYKDASKALTSQMADILKKHDAKGIHFYAPDGQEGAFLLNIDDVPEYLKSHKNYSEIENVKKIPFDIDENIFGRSLKSQYTVYDLSENHNRIVYGADLKLNNPLEYYKPSAETYIKAKDFITQNFKTNNPKYIVLNFNTAGKSKLGAIEKEYVERVKAIVNKIHLDHPEVKILITPVESQFGLEIKNEVDAFLKQDHLKEIVDYMPEDKKLWGPLIEKSELVITQDSGFNHIANIYKDPKEILVLSSNDAASYWRKSNQLYVDGFNNEKDIHKIYHYVDNELGDNPKTLTQKELFEAPRSRDIKFWSQSKIDFQIPHCLVEKLKLLGP